MSDFKTSINEYIRALKTEIEKIESISRVRRQKGLLTGDTLEDIKIDLRQVGKCEVFINLGSTQAVTERIDRSVYLDLLIQINIVGMTDAEPDDIGYSDGVNDTAEDVYYMLATKRNTMDNLVLAKEPILGALTSNYDAVFNKTRETFSTITYTQRIKT